jgi:hypothetical protein
LSPRKAATSRAPKNAKTKRASAAAPAASSAPGAPRAETPFERFVLDFLRARGGSASILDNGDYDVSFDPALARRLRRSGARLVFDTTRAILPRGGLFAAPGSRLGLALLELGRGQGHVGRAHFLESPNVDVDALVRKGFDVHGARIGKAEVGEKRWVIEVVFHATVTYKGGMAEQELRAIVADPRGPRFDFIENEDRRGWKLEEGWPEGPVWWGDQDAGATLPREEAWRLWSQAVEWLNRVLEPRLERWRRRCEESRDRDLARVNAYYETRLTEERERRRRRGQSPDDEDQATEADLKLEWGRRVKSVRARWEPQVEMRLWGVEEIARPRLPVTWTLETPQGKVPLAGEIYLAQGSIARLACPICGRMVGEFWWEGGLVCRRCRGKGGRLAVVPRAEGEGPAPNGRVKTESSPRSRPKGKPRPR